MGVNDECIIRSISDFVRLFLMSGVDEGEEMVSLGLGEEMSDERRILERTVR